MDLDPTLVTWLFFFGGLALMLLETLLPGGVSFFLGVGGLSVAALRAVGLVADPLTALVIWAFVSTGLTLALRPVAMRYFGGDTSVGITNEDAEAMGNIVKVVEPVGEDEPGRIRFRGATWSARSIEGRLPEGAKAQLLYRDNLTWVVQATDHSDLDQELAEALGEDAIDDAALGDVPARREDPDLSDFETRRREHDPSVQPGSRQQTE